VVSVLAREDLGKATATTPVNGYQERTAMPQNGPDHSRRIGRQGTVVQEGHQESDLRVKQPIHDQDEHQKRLGGNGSILEESVKSQWKKPNADLEDQLDEPRTKAPEESLKIAVGRTRGNSITHGA